MGGGQTKGRNIGRACAPEGAHPADGGAIPDCSDRPLEKRDRAGEAIEILEKSGKKFEFPVKWGIDLQSEHERYLAEEYFKKPVFVTDYPKDIKAFYMKLNEDNKTVRAMDLLAPGIGEIIGGSQREDNYELLTKRMKELGLNEEDYEFYLDLRRFGSFPHSGYGLGLTTDRKSVV